MGYSFKRHKTNYYRWCISKILESSNKKPNKVSVDQGCEYYNSSLKNWLSKNHIETYLTYHEGKSIVVEMLIKTYSCAKKYLFWCFKWII